MSSIFGNFGQNNQQQPQQPNAFGQPSGTFGNPTGFNAFGQNNPTTQPQPQVNSMFGSLAPPSTSNTGNSGFGAFANNSNNAFGQPRPTFGSAGVSGTFGGTQPSAFGSSSGTNAFGGTSNAFGGSTGGAFGQTTSQPQPNAFGSGTSLFKPQGSGFGSSALMPATTVPTTGTSNPPFSVTQERDGNNMLHYQSISCMAAYRNASFEELRAQDYQQGRKTASSNTFGTSTSFPQTGQPSGSAFGQTQPTSGYTTFGQQQQQQPQQTTFGAFGQQPQQQQPSSGFSAFGQPSQPQNTTTGFGAFGQPQQPSTGFGAFSQQNKGFGFGQAQNNPNPFGSFGTNVNTTSNQSTFGQTQPPQTQSQSPFGAFSQQSQNPLAKPSVFGQPTTGGTFGQQQGGAFGNTGQPTNIFGNPGQQQSAFGQTASQPQQPAGMFGAQPALSNPFGNANQNQQQQNQQQQPAPGSGFGSLFSKPTGTGIFGASTTQQNQPPQNPNPSNPLFGGGGGLFSNTNVNPQQQPSTTNPLFGGNNTGGLFGGKPPAPSSSFGGLGGGSLFGNVNNGSQQQMSGPGGSIFGTNPTQPSQPHNSLFGATLFGNSSTMQQQQQQQPQQQQPTLTASLDQPLPSTLPTLPSLASSVSPNKKRSNVFADVASRSSPRIAFGHSSGLAYAPPSSGPKLRGFGTSVSTSITERQGLGVSKSGLPFGESKRLLSPEAFSSGAGGSLQLLGGARQSVKKLVLDKRTDEGDLHRIRTQQGGETTPSKVREVRFNPALGVAAREKDNEAGRSAKNIPPQTATPESSSAKVTNNLSSSLNPQEGEYWCLPTVAELQRLSFSELQVVKDFTVGRVGYGTIQFLQPVDLTSVASISDIPGKIVSFEHMECVLYNDERLRPPPGEGLNVPARFKLDRCWAIDKSTRAPIKDPKDPKYQQRLRKMQSQDGTEFVSFDAETGVWEFIGQDF